VVETVCLGVVVVARHEVIQVSILAVFHSHVVFSSGLALDLQQLALVKLLNVNDVSMTPQILGYLELKICVEFEFGVIVGFEYLDALLVHLVAGRALNKVQLGLVSVSNLLGAVEYVRLDTIDALALGINRSVLDSHFWVLFGGDSLNRFKDLSGIDI
jgi:hypothetical protein